MDKAGREAHQWVVPLVLANLQINFRGCWSAGGGPRQKLAVRLRLAPHIRRFHCAPEAHPATRTRAVSMRLRVEAVLCFPKGRKMGRTPHPKRLTHTACAPPARRRYESYRCGL